MFLGSFTLLLSFIFPGALPSIKKQPVLATSMNTIEVMDDSIAFPSPLHIGCYANNYSGASIIP
jgi:hypothetical protein